MGVHGVMHDFEWAFTNLVEGWFGCKYHLACFFLWKKALHKNMVDSGFSDELIARALPKFYFFSVITSEIRKEVE